MISTQFFKKMKKKDVELLGSNNENLLLPLDVCPQKNGYLSSKKKWKSKVSPLVKLYIIHSIVEKSFLSSCRFWNIMMNL